MRSLLDARVWEHMTTSFDDAMRLALTAAREAATAGEVPVGAVLLDPNGAVVATDHNREWNSWIPPHAEMLVLRKGASRAADWRLNGPTLVVTLEPCAMCAMAAYGRGSTASCTAPRSQGRRGVESVQHPSGCPTQSPM